jgi:hypothetical protein
MTVRGTSISRRETIAKGDIPDMETKHSNEISDIQKFYELVQVGDHFK